MALPRGSWSPSAAGLGNDRFLHAGMNQGKKGGSTINGLVDLYIHIITYIYIILYIYNRFNSDIIDILNYVS